MTSTMPDGAEESESAREHANGHLAPHYVYLYLKLMCVD